MCLFRDFCCFCKVTAIEDQWYIELTIDANRLLSAMRSFVCTPETSALIMSPSRAPFALVSSQNNPIFFWYGRKLSRRGAIRDLACSFITLCNTLMYVRESFTFELPCYMSVSGKERRECTALSQIHLPRSLEKLTKFLWNVVTYHWDT